MLSDLELGHRYAFRALTDTPREEELFCDVVSAWTMRRMGKSPFILTSALYALCRNKGDSVHPNHSERDQNLRFWVTQWEASTDGQTWLTFLLPIPELALHSTLSPPKG